MLPSLRSSFSYRGLTPPLVKRHDRRTQWLEREESKSLVVRWIRSSFHCLSSPAISQALSHKSMVVSQLSIRPELLCLFAFCVGCGQPTIPAPQHSPVVPQASQPAAGPNIMPPRYSSVQVFINDHKFGDDGCTFTFSPTPSRRNARIEHGATCGRSDAASSVTWSYLNSEKPEIHRHHLRLQFKRTRLMPTM